ncbi:hypothetical protein AMS68_007916 [Peltaster fructicola]|uniref:Ribosomal protein n=1 Tax=Peltaster fructicola TaxID=286661 RepID=A0A6H0Y6E4_9PEZI|nr:hypothetical protein AMS68_007916 [Peltaster fructicola]
MALQRFCPSCLSATSPRSALHRNLFAQKIVPSLSRVTTHNQIRTAANKSKNKSPGAPQKKKKARNTFLEPSLRDMPQFSLVDAMRYIRAAEVGQKPTSAKYDLAIRLRSVKSGAVARGRLRLPHPIRTDARICVIAAPNSSAGKAATAAGASLVGEETVFEAVKEGRIEFERCICHADSLPKLSKANLGRILGPRGLMPSAKLGTVVKDVAGAVRDMTGGSEYRERTGTIRMAIGQLGFTPEEMHANIRAFMDVLKKDFNQLSDRINKEVHEVVLSSTNGPGISLNGSLRSADSIDNRDLSTLS